MFMNDMALYVHVSCSVKTYYTPQTAWTHVCIQACIHHLNAMALHAYMSLQPALMANFVLHGKLNSYKMHMCFYVCCFYGKERRLLLVLTATAVLFFWNLVLRVILCRHSCACVYDVCLRR